MSRASDAVAAEATRQDGAAQRSMLLEALVQLQGCCVGEELAQAVALLLRYGNILATPNEPVPCDPQNNPKFRARFGGRHARPPIASAPRLPRAAGHHAGAAEATWVLPAAADLAALSLLVQIVPAPAAAPSVSTIAHRR